MLDASAAIYGLETVEAFAEHQPIGRLLEPTEPAALIAWLCSEAASGVTGRRHLGRRRDDVGLSYGAVEAVGAEHAARHRRGSSGR